MNFDEAVDTVRKRDPELKAFIHTRLDKARADYERISKEAPRSPLHGQPFSLKDVWDVEGEPTTAGSYRFKDRMPSQSSRVARVFQEAGAVLIGKTNCSDLCIVPESVNYLCGPTANPHDVTRTAGGSSGGAAAAVAAGMTAFDWGSDIGGSIRFPAALCGVFGLRLSSSRWPSLDHFPQPPQALHWMNGQGPLTASLAQMRKVLDVAAPVLRTGPERPFRHKGFLFWNPDRAGQWPAFAQEVGSYFGRSFAGLTAEIERFSPHKICAIYDSIWASHFFDLLASDEMELGEGLAAVGKAMAFRGTTGDFRFHPNTAKILGLMFIGRHTLYRDAKATLAKARKIREEIEAHWDRGRLIVLPTSVFPAPAHGGVVSRMRDLMGCTVPGNISDATSLAVPFGTFADGLPRSFQIMGPPGSENVILEIAEKLNT